MPPKTGAASSPIEMKPKIYFHQSQLASNGTTNEKTHRTNRLPQILRTNRIQHKRQANRPDHRGADPLQNARDRQNRHRLAEEKQQRSQQQRRQTDEEGQLAGREPVGEDAGGRGEEHAGAGVGGEQAGDVGLDLVVGQVDAVLEDEGEDGDDEAVEEEVGEEADADGADDEEGAGPPLETDWFGFGHVCRLGGGRGGGGGG